MDLNDIKWLFFDMGSTLIDSTDAYAIWFQKASDAVDGAINAQQIAQEYRSGMARYEPTLAGQLRPFGFQESSAAHLYPAELDTPYPQTQPLLERLSARYRLGVIANQVPGARERLQSYGILQYFTFVLGSAEIGLSKPDPRIFQMALAKAGCEPCEAVMIGDRADYDIYPAKQLGLRTIRIRQGYADGQMPRTPAYEADVTVDNLDELGAVLME